MEAEDDLVRIERYRIEETGEWVRDDTWWTRSRLEAFGRQEEMAQETFRWMVRRNARRRFFRITGGLILTAVGMRLVVKTLRRRWV